MNFEIKDFSYITFRVQVGYAVCFITKLSFFQTLDKFKQWQTFCLFLLRLDFI